MSKQNWAKIVPALDQSSLMIGSVRAVESRTVRQAKNPGKAINVKKVPARSAKVSVNVITLPWRDYLVV